MKIGVACVLLLAVLLVLRLPTYARVVPADCDYTNAEINNGWGWSASTANSCLPQPSDTDESINLPSSNVRDNCIHARVAEQDGRGMQSVAVGTCTAEEATNPQVSPHADCDYSGAAHNGGWGWNPVTQMSCSPFAGDGRYCDYSAVWLNDGRGLESVRGSSCQLVDDPYAVFKAACADSLPVSGRLDGDYAAMTQCGFQVRMNRELYESTGLAQQVYRALGDDLQRVIETVPAVTLQMLSGVVFWLEFDVPAFQGGVYHPSAFWLAENGYPKKWAEGIQLGNAQNYLAWRQQQPAIVLHELAHALDHQYHDFSRVELLAAYDHAVSNGLYDSVSHIDGTQQSAYALTNSTEYFAELTEAYFWQNDFFPFHREALRLHDPAGFNVVQQMWLVQ